MPAAKDSSLQRLYSRPGFLLRRAHQISVALFERECAPLGLTPAQYSVLSVLRQRDGLDQTSLAKAIGFDTVTTLRVLALMEKRGLVVRERLETDRRTNAVRLTAEGLALYAKAQKPVERAYRQLNAPFTTPQQAQLVRLLEQLIDALDGHARAPLVRDAADEGEARPEPGRPAAAKAAARRRA
ncbi:MarR family winged helix-turn-helix transcriptional regulator [Piscinibacter sakaiensis]|uniref:MarR family winged helix-turn-helix transcriptional regulator n=1 Tax=Piscinibacter sakaiensis TaxID=1547922 RepID=UPI0006B5B6C2|nr:MarR family transcriptional regulator [Piscinibacter sakaiensis]